MGREIRPISDTQNAIQGSHNLARKETICYGRQLTELLAKQLIVSPPVIQTSLSMKDCDLESSSNGCVNRSVEPEESNICLVLLEPAFYLPGKVEGQSVYYLVDSGCTLNLLGKKIFDRLPLRCTRGLVPFTCSDGTLANGSKLPFHGQIILTGRVRSQPIELTFVVANIDADVILGMPFLKEYNCSLHCADSVLMMNSKELRCTNQCGVDLVSNVQTVADVCIPPHSEKVL